MNCKCNGFRISANKRLARYSGLALVALLLLPVGALAQADNYGQTDQASGQTGQAARAVRLSYVSGQVQVSQGEQAITSNAVANMPLFQGYQITTGQDGQAEVQFEDGSVARIAPDSGLTLVVLTGQGATGQAELVLNGGLGYFELQGGDQAGQIGVRFGDSDVTTAGFTVMRIDMDTPPGALAVFSGNAHLVRGNMLTVDLHGGETVTLNGSEPGNYALADSIQSSSWDQWNSDRDQALQAEAANQTKATDSFVNSENPAWNDLNANGNWYDVPGNGFVWSPFAAAYAGWDPYGCGQWMWMPGWGYSWVSCYSWGYMPYSCGMWNYYTSFGWGWSPGIGGCNPWWGGGYGGYAGYYGYGPNIGNAPSGYRPVIRPPKVLRPPRGRFPHPIPVNRVPEGRYPGRLLRPVDAPVDIAGHRVEPLRPMPARGGLVRNVPGFVTDRANNNQGVRVHGGEVGRPMPIYGGRQGYAPTAPVRTVNSPSRTAERGYQPPRGYAPPERIGSREQGNYSSPNRGYSSPAPGSYSSPPPGTYSSPPVRSEPAPNRGGYGGGGRPSSGGFNNGGGFRGGAAPNSGGFHGGGAPGGGGGFHGGGVAGGGGGFHGGGGGGGGAHGGGGGHR